MEIEKKYLVSHIPDNLDEFHCRHIEQGYLSTTPVLAEVEFSTVEEADNYIAPDFFIKDVTNDSEYHNSNMSKKRFDQ